MRSAVASSRPVPTLAAIAAVTGSAAALAPSSGGTSVQVELAETAEQVVCQRVEVGIVGGRGCVGEPHLGVREPIEVNADDLRGGQAGSEQVNHTWVFGVLDNEKLEITGTRHVAD